jgi:hypothetical protein
MLGGTARFYDWGLYSVPDFVADYLVPQAKEFIDRYRPDILWFDGEWDRPSDYYGAHSRGAAEDPREAARRPRLGHPLRVGPAGRRLAA